VGGSGEEPAAELYGTATREAALLGRLFNGAFERKAYTLLAVRPMKHFSRYGGVLVALGLSAVSSVALAEGPKFGFAEWSTLLQSDGKRPAVLVRFGGKLVTSGRSSRWSRLTR
jgi:hypothetical protein